jgi:hypothetical protein
VLVIECCASNVVDGRGKGHVTSSVGISTGAGENRALRLDANLNRLW